MPYIRLIEIVRPVPHQISKLPKARITFIVPVISQRKPTVGPNYCNIATTVGSKTLPTEHRA
jgi:hypothetical protein